MTSVSTEKKPVIKTDYVDEYVVRLNREEALALISLTGRVGGLNKHRTFTNNLSAALLKQTKVGSYTDVDKELGVVANGTLTFVPPTPPKPPTISAFYDEAYSFKVTPTYYDNYRSGYSR